MKQCEKEEIEHIILKLKDTSYLNKKIININNQLEVINTQLVGLSSPKFKSYVIENKAPYSMANTIKLMMQEEELIEQRNKYEQQILEYEDLLMSFDEDVRKMVIELYILKRKHSIVARDNNYSRQAMYKKINANFIKEFTM